MIEEIFKHPMIFKEPLKVDGNNTWVQHIPFAFFLISFLKPQKIVELGVHTGESFFAFCQAIKMLGLNSICYGIDSWEGDPHTGFNNDSIYKAVLSYQVENYNHVSSIHKMRFDSALDIFEEKSIHLLHIDGYHTYEAVKNDFEKWLPKVSENGVILFHDIDVRERDFGVWKLWEEIKNVFPSIEFNFGFGLGCIVNDRKAVSYTSMIFEKIQNDSDTKLLFEKLGSKNLLIGEILRLKYQLQLLKQ